MKNYLLTGLLTLGIAGFNVLPSQAASISWALQRVMFEDNSVATGSFDYNADTNTYSNLNIEVSNSLFDGFPFTFTDTNLNTNPSVTNASRLQLQSGIGMPFIRFVFDSDLTNTFGTTVSVISDDPDELFGTVYGLSRTSSISNASTGNVQSIPEPLTILGTGVAIAFGTGFKRKLAKAKKK